MVSTNDTTDILILKWTYQYCDGGQEIGAGDEDGPEALLTGGKCRADVGVILTRLSEGLR